MTLTDLQWSELKKAIDEIQWGTIEITSKGGSCSFIRIIETKILGNLEKNEKKV